MTRLAPLLGILTILALGFLLSKNRRAINWRLVTIGLGLQILVALLVFRTYPGYWLLEKTSNGFMHVLNYSFEGSAFVFGPLGQRQGRHPAGELSLERVVDRCPAPKGTAGTQCITPTPSDATRRVMRQSRTDP